MLKKILLFILAVFQVLSIRAQFGSAPGGHPPWVAWRQIDTDTVRVIYPEGMEAFAQRAAGMIHYMYANNRESIGPRAEKFNILLRNHTIIPNGFVGSNPYRSEFYATPAITNFSGTIDWLDLLTIHEYRHVMQVHNSKVGVTRFAYWLFGEGAWAGMSYLAIPNWFDEGDAVVMETALSPSGRGRLPKFLAGFKALSLENKRYPYEKLRNGSLKHTLPNHYPLGYLMSSYVRNHFGNQTWRGIYNDAHRYRGWFYPFSKALRKRTGMRTPELYHAALNEMDSLWRMPPDEDARKGIPSMVNRRHLKNTPTFYSFPQFVNDSIYIVAKRSFKEAPGIYQINDEGEERKLSALGNSFDNNFSYKNGTVVWSELTFHPRWDYVNYYVIRRLDITTREIRTLTERTKYVAPDLSNNGEQIVAVQVTPQRDYQLHILDARKGDLQSVIPDEEGVFWASPRWTSDDQFIVAVSTRNQQNALVKIDPNTGTQVELVPYTSNLIEHPVVSAEQVFFTSSFLGTDNIFVVDLEGGSIRQVTHAKVKASTAGVSADGRWLMYTEQTADGNNIHKMKLSPTAWTAVAITEPLRQAYLINDIAAAEGGNILGKNFELNFPVEKYSWFEHFIRPHSWAFLPQHPVYSLRLNSTNYLGTFNLEAGPEYNYNEESFSFVTTATYSQLFPVFDLSYDSKFQRSATFLEPDVNNPDTLIRRSWNESDFIGIIRFPLNFTSRNYNRSLNTGLRYSHNRLHFFENRELPRDNGSYNTIGFFFNFANQQFTATQDVAPRFGQTLFTGYRRTLEDRAGSLFYARGTLYFPGFFRTHSFSVDYGFQRQNAFADYLFSNQFVYPRGFSGNTGLSDDLYKIGFNYHFPIWYADLAIGPLAYIKRFRLNAFFDHGVGRLFANENIIKTSYTYQSVGLELSGDFGLLRIFELPVGIRFSYLVNKPDFVNQQFDVGIIFR